MSIKELAPFISCVCDTDDFDNARNAGYKEIYIKTSKGILKHHQLRGNNRFIRLKVDSIPGYEETKIEEGMNFLPAGKVPYRLFEQIEAFFRKVIQVRGTALEAMIFVLWNQEQGYHLYVPEQSVAAASVNFDPTSLPAGSTVVINVHSHGHMGSFFSGTDDNNDSTLVQFSGVFGSFQQPVPTTVWRFNYYKTKYKCEAGDIFETPAKAEVVIPEEWISKVSQSTPAYRGGHSNQGNVVGGRYDHLKPYQFQKKQETSQRNGNVVAIGTNQSQASEEKNTLASKDIAFAGFDYEEYSVTRSTPVGFKEPHFTPPNVPGAVWKWDYTKNAFRNVVGTPEAEDEDVIKSSAFLGEGPEDELNLSANEAFERAMGLSESALASVVEDPAYIGGSDSSHLGKFQSRLQRGMEQQSLLSQEDNDSSPIFVEAHANYELDQQEDELAMQYEAIANRFGGDVADAWWAIDQEMANLSGHDLLLSGLMSDMFGLLEDDAKLDFFKDMFNNLPQIDQTEIQTHGLS